MARMFTAARLVALLGALALLSASHSLADPDLEKKEDNDWQTHVHKDGYCAMIGICGRRQDKDVLNCPINQPAVAADDALAQKLQATCPTLWAESGGPAGRYCCSAEQVDIIQTNTAKAVPFLVGCPACYHNFMHFWCYLTCSSAQASYTNVSSVQQAFDNNATVVKEVDYWVSDRFSSSLYDSCKDVKFGAANLPAMKFIGGGAASGQEWLTFLGDLKDHRFPPVGSPFQINFHNQSEAPPEITPLDERMSSCGDPSFTCSCADCPAAPGCSMPPPPPPPGADLCLVGPLRCWDFMLLLLYVSGLAACAGLLASAHRGDKRVLAKLFGTTASGGVAEPLLPDGGGDGAAATVGATAVEAAAATAAVDDSELEPGDEHMPWLERGLQRFYRAHGESVARQPVSYILAGLVLAGLCMSGLMFFQVETRPERLWVGPGSQAAKEKAAYEASFGPFYRVEQIILSTTPDTPSKYLSPSGLPAILSPDRIELLFKMQALVDDIAAPLGTRNVTLRDICFQPFGDACATQSLLQFWKMDRNFYTSEQAKGPWVTKLTPDYCFSHWYTQCRSAFQAPMDPHLVLGGFPMGPDFRNYSADATAFVVTYPIDADPSNVEAARAWEAKFVALATGELSRLAEQAHLKLSFSSERSVQDELTRESTTDAGVVAVSYLVMLVYITLALSVLPPKNHLMQLFVLSRVGLGLAGVLIVAASVAGALGLASAAGVWSTLIIMEVIPFLVLAVGVDNMFVLVHALGRQDPSLPLPRRMGLAMGVAGPSITLASGCEVLAFGLGALTPMPAVRNFTIVAALAVALDFALQMTVFAAVLVLDTQRMQWKHLDCAPCLRMPAAYEHESDEDDEDAYYGSGGANSYEPLESVRLEEPGVKAGKGSGAKAKDMLSLQAVLQRYMERVHAPALMKPAVQVAVLLIFVTASFLSLAAVPRLEIGLDQSIALPQDSYLQGYFVDVMKYLRVGPPLFLVVDNLEVDPAAGGLDKVCSVAGCRRDSLTTRVSQAALNPSSSFISSPAASWADDFLSWISPSLPSCCREHPAAPGGPPGGRCPPSDQPPCSVNATACADCHVCFTQLEGGRPTVPQVQHYLPWFLQAMPSEGCAKGGAGVYTGALALDAQDPTGVAGLSSGKVGASSFRTYYTPLNQQKDFINSMAAVHSFVAKARKELELPSLYAYSVFHIFFEQYLHVGSDAFVLLFLPWLAVSLAAWAFTASLWSSLLLAAMLAGLLLNLLGAMYLAGIQLNAVSLVNLAMALGIAVEFCAHILHSFGVAHGSRRARAEHALRAVGASVLSGITLTKFAGVAVLAFARTRIFEVFYFRLYLSLVIIGAFVGLVLLPVVLALVGPPSWADQAAVAEDATAWAGSSSGGQQQQQEEEEQGAGVWTRPAPVATLAEADAEPASAVAAACAQAGDTGGGGGPAG